MVNIEEHTAAKKLAAEVEEIDNKIKEHNSILIANNVDMNSPLVDEDGYPKVNIDVISIRKARHAIICLINDRKKLMDQMLDAVSEWHQSVQIPADSKPSTSYVRRTSNEPFTTIQSVMPNSPADAAGFKSGDLVIQFGNLHKGNFTEFTQLKEYVRNSINKTIYVTVFRDDIAASSHVFHLELVPRTWDGQGVIGCTFGPVEK